jgi:adenylate cyclase class 2
MPGRGIANREVEIKLRIVNLEKLVSDLRRMRIQSLGRVLELNALYDTARSQVRKRGCLLRLRTETPAASPFARGGPKCAVVTWKTPAENSTRSRYKEKIEQEAPVESADRWPQILPSLGLRPTFSYEKYRTMYRAGALHLDLDETPVGVFLELEGHPRAIDRMARCLGFTHRDYLRDTYWDLYAADCRRRGHTPRNMVFKRKN